MKWILIDVSNLCWRAFHTTKALSHGGKATGVVFGFLKELQNLGDTHATQNMVFCFDVGSFSIRKQMNPNYKKKRHGKELTETEEREFRDMKRQIRKLRTTILPKMGLTNILSAKGYEGDDIIASVCKSLPEDDEKIIVSTDKDLWQLLGSKVTIWNPIKKSFYTEQDFRNDHLALAPYQWAYVKAIAGCSSDEIEGIRGIGEITACKYMAGQFDEQHRISVLVYKNKKRWKENIKLVKLPLKGCPQFEVTPCVIDPIKWKEVTLTMGMVSLANKIPGKVTGFGLRPFMKRETKNG